MRNLSRETGYRLQNFLVIRCHRENWFVRKTRAPAVIEKKKKKILAQKSLDLFERIYDETGCARSKDRRRKSEKQISIMRALFSTMKTKLEEAIEMEVSLNFKLNRSRRLRFSSLPNRPVMIFVIL